LIAGPLEQNPMTLVPLQTTIGEGKDKHVDLLFTGPRRKLIQITLRNGARLERHTAPVPITIQCVAGSGTFLASDAAEPILLTPGVLLTLGPDVPHEVTANPTVSILLTQFMAD
jgi:quercetin dioxygenase-like cupin family protein